MRVVVELSEAVVSDAIAKALEQSEWLVDFDQSFLPVKVDGTINEHTGKYVLEPDYHAVIVSEDSQAVIHRATVEQGIYNAPPDLLHELLQGNVSNPNALLDLVMSDIRRIFVNDIDNRSNQNLR